MRQVNQVKSKQRVSDHGEVFTAEREVNAMLDLVKHEAERIDSRCLEPSCGTGNFLVAILKRKLSVVQAEYRANQTDFERNAVLAVSSLYGVDILYDNVQECRHNLFSVFDDLYSTLYGKKSKKDCRASILFILDRNIVWGNTLTQHTPDAQPIVFSEWSFDKYNLVRRRDYAFAELVQATKNTSPPLPLKEFPLTHFLQLHNCEDKLQSRRTDLLGEPEQRRGVHAPPLGEPNVGHAARGTLAQQRREVSRSGL